ncbi:hypothetical protein BK771_12630 [Bacillus thuringiensis serovar ostriniae]|nr:hypothetical protein BK771_12630 [Bacillus thuringiensis serovar ostriniae]
MFELLKLFLKTIVRKISAYVFRKQILEKDNKNPTPRRRRKQKGGIVLRNFFETTIFRKLKVLLEDFCYYVSNL